MSLYTKILTVSLFPLIIFFSAGLFQIGVTAKRHNSVLSHHYETQRISVQKNINQIISRMATAAAVLSESEEISNALQKVDNEKLFDMSSNFVGSIDSVIFSDATGLVISRAPDEFRFGDTVISKKYFKITLDKGEFFGVEKIDKVTSFIFSKSIKQYDDIDVGVVCIVVNITPELLNSVVNSPELLIELVLNDHSIRSTDQNIHVVHQVSIQNIYKKKR